MKSIIKGQTAILVSMLAAFAITLTACGGGSSSSSAGGGTSLNVARVTGSVAGGGVAGIDFRNPTNLMAAVSDMIIPVAHADSASEVTVMCPGVAPVSGPVTNGTFTVDIALPDGEPANCEVLVDGQSGGNVTVQNGSTTTINVVVDDDSPPIVTASAPTPSSNPDAGTVAGDVTSSDDDSIASTDSVDDDSVASTDSVDDDSDDSESEDEDSESDDDSSDTTNNV